MAWGLLGVSWGPLGPSGGVLRASWGLLVASLGPLGRVLGPLGRVLGLPWGLRGAWGRLQGAPEAENTVKPTYFHVFCRVSGGPGDPPRNRSIGLREGKFADFGRGGNLLGGG